MPGSALSTPCAGRTHTGSAQTYRGEQHSSLATTACTHTLHTLLHTLCLLLLAAHLSGIPSGGGSVRWLAVKAPGTAVLSPGGQSQEPQRATAAVRVMHASAQCPALEQLATRWVDQGGAEVAMQELSCMQLQGPIVVSCLCTDTCSSCTGFSSRLWQLYLAVAAVSFLWSANFNSL